MTDKDILMEMHGDIKALKTDMEHTKNGVSTIFDLMNEGKCPTGRANKAIICWMWAVILGGGGGILALIIRLHL